MSDVQQAESSAVDQPPPESSAADHVPDDSNASGVLPAPIHVPEGQWTCLKCGKLNSPSLKRMLVKSEAHPDGVDEDVIVPQEDCWHCHEPRHLTLEQLGCSHRTIQALAGGLVDQAQSAAGVEQVARGDAPPAESRPTKASDRELPFPKGRFDPDRAFEAIARQNHVVCSARDEYEDLKEQASQAKKTLDKEEETLSELINREDAKKHGGEQQPYLREVESPAPASCAVSVAMGAPCPACASQRAKGEEADVNDPLHPAHPQHEAIAKSLLVKDAQDLSVRLMGKHFYMEAAALMLLPIDDLQTLQRYSVQKGVVPPPLLTNAHIAAKAGSQRQECKHCGLLLLDLTTVEHAAYPENAAIGLDCEGRSGQKAEEVKARPPTSHAKKRKAKKAEPEVERQAQTSEGRKKAAGEKPTKKKAKK